MKINYLMQKLIFTAVLLLGSITLFAQQISVKGIVKDAAGEPIIGASILVFGTNSGTITDYDGKFELMADKAAKLVISYIGYKTQEVTVSTGQLIITLAEDAEILDEVVVVGYGVVKKNDATGSVTAIKPDEMNKGLVTNAQDMLQGKVAGVSVVSSGGAPGASATIRIRGGSSLSASNDPLIVIDGLAMDNNGIQGVSNPLAMVNPNDIETFTVLKDASATAIYGSRASNGVIIITTKKGAAGSKPKFSYEGNVSMSNLVHRMDVLSADELRSYANALFDITKTGDAKKLATLGNANTNWQDEIYQLAVSSDHNISVTGGAKNMPYRASLGYTYQDGVIKTSNMQRVTAAVNLSPSFLDNHLKFNLNTKGMYITNRYNDGGVVGAALSMDPTQEVYDNSDTGMALFGGFYQNQKDANYDDPTWVKTVNQQTTANPVATLMTKDDRAKAASFVGNVEADYEVHGFEDLHFHANFGADYSTGTQRTVIDPTSYTNHYYGWDGYTTKQKYNLALNAYAQYSKDFEAPHHLDAMLGYEWQHFYNDGNTIGQGTYQTTNNNLSLRGTAYNYTENEWASENYLVSFFGRINYIALNRYMITATVRSDGSSRFSPNNRWGIFPSMALGWKLKEEAFLKDVYWLSELKLRLGYGVTGQQDINQGDYPYLATYTSSKENAFYTLGEIGTDGNYIYYSSYRPGAYNADLTWEKTTTYNAGIDFGFLRSRITGSIDYYYRNTTDLINVVDVPAGTNFKNRVISNVGSLRNQGVEFAINAKAIDTKKLQWDLGFNATYNDNQITQLSLSDSEDYYIATGGISSGKGNNIQAHKVGYSASSFYVYETKLNEQGEWYFVDRDLDGSITADDKYMYHSPAPDVLMGITSKWQFHNFDLSFSLRASVGNYVYNDVLATNLQWAEKSKIYTVQRGGFSNISRLVYETYNRADSPFKSDNANLNGEWYLSDYFVEDASFLRCDNITLGYTFNKPNIKARVYATVQNPFVITKYTGLDPEISGGIDRNIYPRSLVSLVGVSLQF
jgi:TonB-linked SusC/RagA family outer membrane protein